MYHHLKAQTQIANEIAMFKAFNDLSGVTPRDPILEIPPCSTHPFNCPGTAGVSVAPLGPPAWSGTTPRGSLGCLCKGGARYTNGMNS